MSDSVQPHRRQLTRLLCPWDSPGKNTGEGCHFLLQRMQVKSESEVAQSCPTLSNPMDCSLPGSSVHGIFQARVQEWGAIAFSGSASSGSLKTAVKVLARTVSSQDSVGRICFQAHSFGFWSLEPSRVGQKRSFPCHVAFSVGHSQCDCQLPSQ